MKFNLVLLKSNLVKFVNLLRSSKKLTVGFSIFTIIICIALLKSAIQSLVLVNAPPSYPEATPISGGAYARYLGLSLQHPLGTDMYGRDLMMLNIIALNYSLSIGFIAALISTLVAVTFALVGAMKGGLIDGLLNFITNQILVLPTLPILLVIATYVTISDIFALGLLLALFSWPWAARTIRSQALSLKNRAYIDFAKISNERDLEIIFLEILPNLVPYILVGFATSIIVTIVTETGIRLVGIGSSSINSIGYIINLSILYSAFSTRSYNLLLPPILSLAFIFVSVNLMNAGLDEVFNPRLRKI